MSELNMVTDTSAGTVMNKAQLDQLANIMKGVADNSVAQALEKSGITDYMSQVSKAKQAEEQQAEQQATLSILTKAIAEPILEEFKAIKADVASLKKAETNVDVHNSKSTKGIEPETTDTNIENKANTITNDEVRKAADADKDDDDDDNKDDSAVNKAEDGSAVNKASDSDNKKDDEKSDSDDENEAEDKLMSDISKGVADLLAKGEVTKAHGLLSSHLSKAKAENKSEVSAQVGSKSINNKAGVGGSAINKGMTSSTTSDMPGHSAFRNVMDDIYKHVPVTDVKDLIKN